MFSRSIFAIWGFFCWTFSHLAHQPASSTRVSQAIRTAPAWRRSPIRSISRWVVHGRRIAVPVEWIDSPRKFQEFFDGTARDPETIDVCKAETILLEIVVVDDALPCFQPRKSIRIPSSRWEAESPTAVAVGSHNYSCCSYSPVAACQSPTHLVASSRAGTCGTNFSLVASCGINKIDKMSDFHRIYPSLPFTKAY